MKRELLRKLLHLAMGGFAFLIPYLTWWQTSLLAAVALLHNLLLFPRYGGRRLFRGAAAQHGHDPGIVLYPAAVLALSLLFAPWPAIVAAAWGLLAFGDGMATICGVLAGPSSPRLPWNHRKSWAGWFGFLIFGAGAAWVLWRHTTGEPVSTEQSIQLVVVALFVAIIESLELGVDDNIVVPLAGAGLLLAASCLDLQRLVDAQPEFLARLPWAVGVNLLLAVLAMRARSVDLSGAIHGSLLGVALWVFGGGLAFAMLFAFFVLGSGATKLGYKTKLAEGTAQEKGGRRSSSHAWANAGAGTLFALLYAGSGDAAFLLGVIAAFATAASDTLGSEIGQAYGRRTFLITSFRSVPRGTDGAVSLEGTLAGVAGSLLLGVLAIRQIGAMGVLIVVLAAFVGTTVESYLGAIFERAKQINNEAQNLLNTLVGGLSAIGLSRLLG
jgi:uncharacterized protein (TIGR00297 family)